MDTNTYQVLAHDELRVQAALLRTPEFMAQFDPDKFAGQLERIAAALASAPPSAHSDDMPTLLDNLMRAAYDDGDLGIEKFSCETIAAREAVLAHVRSASVRPSAPAGVDFAAVASVLRRALRDGTHYGYRRDFILQQALALEAISQQPAAVGMTKRELFTIAAMHTLHASDYAMWEHLAQDAVSLADATIAALATQHQEPTT